MRRLISLIWGLLITLSTTGQVKIDTMYYDKNWKGVEDKIFASYLRVITCPKDDNCSKKYRDYYITGELQSEGGYITIDRNDDAKSIFNGECINYYKSGKIEIKRTFVVGKPDGEYTQYKEDGSIFKHAYFKNGRLNGIYTEFIKEGDKCIQIEYKDSIPVGDYYVMSDKNGYCSKVRLSDNTPIYESPDLSERQVRYNDGKIWLCYEKNGIEVNVSNELIRDYGKYFQVAICIANNSMFHIDFFPEHTTAMLFDVNNKPKILKVYSAEEYMARVRHRQNWIMALHGFSEGLAAAGAGYSHSTTHTSYSGYSSNYGSGYIYGNGEFSYGNYSGNTLYSGSAYSSTTTYDGAAAYQAQVIASNRIARFNDSMLSERTAKNKGYLKKTTLEPGDVITGYINIDRKGCKAGTLLKISININGAIYTFPWNIADPK